MAKGGGWFRPGRSEHKAGDHDNGGPRVIRTPDRIHHSERRTYVEVEMPQQYVEAGVPLPWPDVHLPRGLHLNQARVLVPTIPMRGPDRCRDILQHRPFLSPDLWRDPTYIIDFLL
jgi:hypothetical protein